MGGTNGHEAHFFRLVLAVVVATEPSPDIAFADEADPADDERDLSSEVEFDRLVAEFELRVEREIGQELSAHSPPCGA